MRILDLHILESTEIQTFVTLLHEDHVWLDFFFFFTYYFFKLECIFSGLNFQRVHTRTYILEKLGGKNVCHINHANQIRIHKSHSWQHGLHTSARTHTRTKTHSLLSGAINQSRAKAVLLLHLSALWSSCRPFAPTALSALHCDSSDPHVHSFLSQRLMPYLYACTDGTFSIRVWCLVVNCYNHATSQKPL